MFLGDNLRLFTNSVISVGLNADMAFFTIKGHFISLEILDLYSNERNVLFPHKIKQKFCSF